MSPASKKSRRAVLGNDPFSRGAPARPEPPPNEPSEDEASKPAALPPLIAVLPRKQPRNEEAERPARRPPAGKKKPRQQRASKAPQEAPPKAPHEPPPREPAELPVAAPLASEVAEPASVAAPSSTGAGSARALLETTGAKLRDFLEKRLPALIQGVTRSSIEALGLTAQPVRVSEVDDFGMSAEFVARWHPVLARVLHDYFRTQLLDFEKLPRDGAAILVCNHSGVLPYDELLLEVAVREGSPGGGPGRELRPLSEDFAINAPFAGSWLNRFGLVRASQDNATRLLGQQKLVAVFPEGTLGLGKPYRDRYRLQRFGRGGFIRLALRTGVPVYPVALLGGEESQPVMARVRLPRPLRPSHLPITPTFPWLGPAGLLPLPARWTVRIGDPVVLPHDPGEAENRPLVAKLAEDVRETLQGMLDGMNKRRGSLYL